MFKNAEGEWSTFLSLALYVSLIVGCVWWASRVLPSEDAAMLFCYSENLADTGVISYYPGGPPAEGATDFLWMALLAAMYKIGIPTYLAAVSTGLVPLMLLTELVARRCRSAKPALVRIGIVTLVLCSPFFLAHLVGFSILFFGSAVGAAMISLIFRSPVLLYACGVLACLIRPDGIVFLTGMIAARFLDIVVQARTSDKEALVQDATKEVLRFGIIFCCPLGLYWLARWGYFHSFFPLSFQVKSVVPDSLGFVFGTAASVLENARVMLLCLPLFLSVFLFPRTKDGRYWVAVTLLAVFVPALLFYSRMDLQNNIGSRLQFPFFFMAIILFFLFASSRLHLPIVLLLSASLSMSTSPNLFPMSYHWKRYNKEQSVVFKLGAQLRQLRGIKLMVSEAGLIPYLSKAESYDTWGLNTPDFAVRLIQPEDVRRIRPDLIYVNGDADVYASLTGAESPRSTRGWHQHIFNVFLGAKRMGNYELYQIPLSNHPTGDVRPDEVLIRRDSLFYWNLKAIIVALPGSRDRLFVGEGGCPDHC